MNYYLITPGWLFGMLWPSCKEIPADEALDFINLPNTEKSLDGLCWEICDSERFDDPIYVAHADSRSAAKALADDFISRFDTSGDYTGEDDYDRRKGYEDDR